ncbi:type II toxin-antitoxin system HicB family antitoxin [Halobacteriaceae archaeon SHR40]|uniref:type II toxin-antitoxin system HicB family antitoxin n=1 Tax=Halovenus amylolytica TaxID=2500550 RepID=UPI000FE304F3
MIERPTPDFELSEDGDLWVAAHVYTGIASHGETPSEAVRMAEEAVQLHQAEHKIGDEEYQQMMLDRFDIDIDTSC